SEKNRIMVYCVFVGAFKEKRFRQASEEYRLWLERLWPVTVIEIPEKDKDIARLIEAKKGRGTLVSLDAHGESMDSKAFTRWVTQSSRDLYFLCWGANGPPPEFLKAKLKSLSLSPMTYPHELARVLLMEQL